MVSCPVNNMYAFALILNFLTTLTNELIFNVSRLCKLLVKNYFVWLSY